jgi:hypothetical protein
MEEFDNMILNVRNSFRLLYFFNRRILDLMKYIGNKFGIPFAGGYSMFSDPSPKNGTKNILGRDRWAWDWLNMYFYGFHFKKEKISLAIILQSDTGKWDSNVENLDVENYEETSKSKTKLIFIFSNNNNEYWDIVNEVYENENLNKGKFEKTFKIPINKKNMYCMVFDISEFINKEATDNSLNKFIKYLNDNSIYDLKLVNENM